MSGVTTPRSALPPDTVRDPALAWVSVVLIPVAFAAAFMLGEALATAAGYPAGEPDATVPLGAAVAISIPVALLGMLPGAGAIWFGLRARQAGHDAALVAVGLGVAAIAFWVLTFVLALGERMA
jgi:hypothetical protein